MTLQIDFSSDIAGMHPFVPAKTLVYAVNISLKNRYIYVETPKCACSTMKISLQRWELEDTEFFRDMFEDIHAREFSPLLNPLQVPSFRRLCDDKRFFKFCIVRHPATRLLSAYLDKIKRNRLQKMMILRQLGMPEQMLSAKVSFEQFVRAVCAQPVGLMDNHWGVQTYLTFQRGIKYDFIGRFEDMPRTIEQIIAGVGEGFRDYMVTELRHQTKAGAKLSKYLTPELLAMIYERYRVDYEEFGYGVKPG